LYDEDERIAPRAATIMMERGYTNIFLLSGGKYSIDTSRVCDFNLV